MRGLKIFSILLVLFLVNTAEAQFLYRIEADFSIKEKGVNGHENLILGKVYYDKNYRQQIFQIKFPENEIMVVNDTATIIALSKQVKKHNLKGNLINFSVFHLFLNGDLDYFGLQNTPYHLIGVEKEKDLVISTWELADNVKGGNAGRLLLSQKNGLLHGLITFGVNDVILSKQIFSEYIDIDGLKFPSKVLQISYLPDGSELKKISQYKNLKLNNSTSNVPYNYQYSDN